MMLRITHCAEDALAAGLSAMLLDRVVVESASSWLRDLWTPELRGGLRSFVDLEGREGWSSRTHLRDVQRRSNFRVHPRHVGTNRPLVGSAALAYLCVRLAASIRCDVPHVVMIAFDTDGKPETERCAVGVEAATEGRALDYGVLVAEAHPEFDAWVIAGFKPGATHERAALAEAIRELTFDPTIEPHRLTSNVSGDARDAKVLCRRLLALDDQASPDDARVLVCVLDTRWDELMRRGAHVGLAAFARDVLRVVVPLLGDRQPVARDP